MGGGVAVEHVRHVSHRCQALQARTSGKVEHDQVEQAGLEAASGGPTGIKV